MKVIVCLVMLAVCAEALPRRRVVRNAQEVQQNDQREHELKLQRLRDQVKHAEKLRQLEHGRKKRQAVDLFPVPATFVPPSGGFACNSNPCQNGGYCYPNGTSFACACNPGYGGSRCEMICQCPQGFPSCGQGEMLENRQLPGECCPRYECVQIGYPYPTYMPPPDPCTSYPCPNGGSCYVDMNGYPQCYSVGVCSSNPCLNGGSCVNQGSSFYCYCSHGYSGLTCGNYNGYDPCASYPCPYGGSCYVDLYGYPQCYGGYPSTYIPPASTCQDETYTVTPGSEQIITHTYSNHDDCTWTVNVAMGYEQNNVVEAEILGTSIEANSNCPYDSLMVKDYNNDNIAQFCGSCTGTLTASGPTMLIRFMSDSSVIGYDQVPHFTAEHMRIRLRAVPANNQIDRTTQVNQLGSQQHCTVAGHVGPDPCASAPCLNGGSCFSDYGGFYCQCHHGFDGRTCNMTYSPCNHHYCYNGGTCQVAEVGYGALCLCPSGYTGWACETAPPVPCGNNNTEMVRPNQPIQLRHDYRDNQDCIWTYMTPNNQPNLVLRVEVMNTDIEQNSNCGFDRLMMSDPMNPAMVSDHLCGACSEGFFMTGSGQLRVNFHSDDSVVGMNRDGNGMFEVMISAVPNNNAAANQISSFGPATCTAADPNGEGSGFPEWSTMIPPRPMSCDALGVSITAGQVLPAALVTDRETDGNYRNFACQRWNIASTEGECIVVVVGAGAFNTESGFDYVTFQDSNNASVIRREGMYSVGETLFTSQTNRVNVNFTSDSSVRHTGFTLDVRSIHCSERDQYPPVPISTMGTPGPEGSGWSEPTSMPAVVNIVNDPVYIDDHPYGYHLRYPETGNQYPNNANVTWDIRLRNQPGKALMFNVFQYDTETSFDFLHINSTQKEVARLDGHFPDNFPVALVPCSPNGVGTCAKIHFRSDGSVTTTGFVIIVKLVDEAYDPCDPNPCTEGGHCRFRQGDAHLNQQNNGGYSGAGRPWYPWTTVDLADESCKQSGTQVCCRCDNHAYTRDCAPMQYGNGMTTHMPWY